MLYWFYCQFGIWKSSVIWNWKIQLLELFNYLIWFDRIWNLVQIIDYIFNLVIWIDFVKENWIEKGRIGTKTQIPKHSLVQMQHGFIRLMTLGMMKLGIMSLNVMALCVIKFSIKISRMSLLLQLSLLSLVPFLWVAWCQL